jgi:glycosyltransferase domain-containing protein
MLLQSGSINKKVSRRPEMPAKLSVVIPTYNRPHLLPRALGFLKNEGCVPIIVADGSSQTSAEINSRTCLEMGCSVTYFHTPSAEGSVAQLNNAIQRLCRAVSLVKTPYVVFCGDDDLLMLDSALACVDFLEKNESYVGCQGLVVGFQYELGLLRLEHLEYQDASIDGSDICTRLMQLFSRYESPFYCVSRTPIQRQVLEQATGSISGAFFELFHATAVVVRGKIKRLSGLHYLRDMTSTTSSAAPVADQGTVRPGNFLQWAANDFDGLFSAYTQHREKIINAAIHTGAKVNVESLKRCLDMTFIIYLGRQFHLSSWIDEYVTRNIPSTLDGDSLRARFYRNFGIVWPQPSQPKLKFRQRLAKKIEDPMAALRSLKARAFGMRAFETRFAMFESENGARLAINPSLLPLFSKEIWPSLLSRLERSTV